MERFWLALGFLTRLPAPVAASGEGMGRALPVFPLVGLVVGALLLLVHALFGAWPPGVQAAVVLIAWVLVTGALHLDGLADSADGFAGGRDRDSAVAIMRDSRSGAVGVVALVLVLLTKWAALAAGTPWQALLLAPVLGRLAAAWLLFTTPYARPEGLGSAFLSGMPAADMKAGAVLTLLAVPILAGTWGLAVSLAVIAFYYLYRRFLLRWLGGTTGDTTGALVELIETLVLVGFAA